MFVLFEGLDLSGKSTLCRELQRALGWELRRNSLLPPGCSPFYDRADAARLSGSGAEIQIGGLYLEALRLEIVSYTPSPQPCIQDSTILLRSLAYHSASGNDGLANGFRSLVPDHPRPALTFVCRPGTGARLRRLEGRISRGNDAAEDLLVRDAPALFARMEECLEADASRLFNAEFIDTSNLEDPQARAELVGVLSERLRCLT